MNSKQKLSIYDNLISRFYSMNFRMRVCPEVIPWSFKYKDFDSALDYINRIIHIVINQIVCTYLLTKHGLWHMLVGVVMCIHHVIKNTRIVFFQLIVSERYDKIVSCRNNDQLVSVIFEFHKRFFCSFHWLCIFCMIR